MLKKHGRSGPGLPVSLPAGSAGTQEELEQTAMSFLMSVKTEEMAPKRPRLETISHSPPISPGLSPSSQSILELALKWLNDSRQTPNGLRQSMPPEYAWVLLQSPQYDPGPRPLSFDRAAGQWFFKESSGPQSRRAGGTSDSDGGAIHADRWHNSGGSKNSRDLPTGKGEPLVKRRYGAVEKPSGGRGFSYHEYVILRYEQATKLMIEDRTQVLYHVMPKREERPVKSTTRQQPRASKPREAPGKFSGTQSCTSDSEQARKAKGAVTLRTSSPIAGSGDRCREGLANQSTEASLARPCQGAQSFPATQGLPAPPMFNQFVGDLSPRSLASSSLSQLAQPPADTHHTTADGIGVEAALKQLHAGQRQVLALAQHSANKTTELAHQLADQSKQIATLQLLVQQQQQLLLLLQGQGRGGAHPMAQHSESQGRSEMPSR